MKVDGIHSFFEEDWRRLEALLGGFARLKDTNFVAARECFRQFAAGLRRRIEWEETLLFPVYERARGGDTTTGLMRSEHRAIDEDLDSIDEQLKKRGVGAATEAEAHLRTALAAHEREELRSLLPAVDSAATADDLARLQSAVTAFEHERNTHEYLL